MNSKLIQQKVLTIEKFLKCFLIENKSSFNVTNNVTYNKLQLLTTWSDKNTLKYHVESKCVYNFLQTHAIFNVFCQ